MFRSILFASVLALLPSPAAAQGPVLAAAANASPPGTSQPRRDSLWNGVLVGAGLGAVLGGFAGSAALQCSECAGFNVPLAFGAIGAGAGAAIGAGIDALRHARTRVPGPGAPDRTERRRTLSLSPVLGKDVQAVVGSLRF
jgi:hypothetical protein